MANAAIPIHLAHVPTHNGMVIPYITLRHADGTPELGRVDHNLVAECLTGRRCQLCARPLDTGADAAAVVMARPMDFGYGYVPEPAQHPECAAYAIRACPMLSGRLPRLRDRTRPQRRQCTAVAACWCGLDEPPSVDAIVRSGRPATPWYSVRFPMTEYELLMTARQGPRGISLHALTNPKIRLVSWGDPEWDDMGRAVVYGLPLPDGADS
ncbi:hypothetical protein [Nonomuraea wenchangensis]|uniref:Uncharacterized protein n=1 Tax=Nonomuraea wenchangensis TaxID=568860 RepID=A0A1I0LV47_9ACTN|nr:hypothetical protein [Nonomuraea wenchangensis]SEU46828.1 hypothetical protein SAMN05421811_127153 [Nonomuraea wenchangensis]